MSNVRGHRAVLLLALVLCLAGCEKKLDRAACDRAVYNGDLGPLKELMARDSAAIFQRDPATDRTALHFAAYLGDEEFVVQLLEAGAEVDPRDVDKHTPLSFAADRGHVAILGMLVDAGADINTRTKIGDTPLHEAVFWKRMNAVRYLIEYGAEVNTRGYLGWSPLHVACAEERYPDSTRVLVEILLESGADISARTDEGFHALHYAVQSNHFEICEMLFARGESVDPNLEHHSAFAQAARFGRLEIAQLLISRGADIRRLDKNGRTPLSLAISGVASRSDDRLNQRGLIIREGEEIGPADTSEMSPQNRDRIRLVELIIESGDVVNRAGRDGKPPLHQAVIDEKREVVELLVSKGADVNLLDANGWPPLHWAASRNDMRVLVLLVEEGADINFRDLRGMTALQHTSSQGSSRVVLKDYGAR